MGSSARIPGEDHVGYYLSDLSTGTVTRLNDGVPAYDGAGVGSHDLQLSADGTVVVFSSHHALVEDQLNYEHQYGPAGEGLNTFLYETGTGTYRQVNLDHNGERLYAWDRTSPGFQFLSGDGSTLIASVWATEENDPDATSRPMFLRTLVTDGSTELLQPLNPDGSVYNDTWGCPCLRSPTTVGRGSVR